eukprot:TRINITY_DN48773_c0_g1_i1.p1 TRINITY_DN48773_c0_g1~~TRINITY_DN48773_c0_g1_i1.p1  ORF type:complete len:1056 (+),score=68.53 TRINITY_DN48773_c0_g1_i1:242-3169(+)
MESIRIKFILKDRHMEKQLVDSYLKRDDIIGEYQVEKKIAEGGFGAVYLGVKIDEEKLIVIKQIPTEEKKEESARAEINLLREIDHENIVRLLDTIYEEEYTYLIYEYCRGGDMVKYINDHGGKLDEHKVKNFIRQIVRGYGELRKRFIAHRDIKPENLFIHYKNAAALKIDEPTIKLGDFGIACDITFQKIRKLIGTKSYMAPEILRRNAKYNYLVDIWSLGATMYTMLHGRSPFEDFDEEVLKGIDQGKYTVRQDLTMYCVDFLCGCLQDDPTRRLTFEEIMAHPFLTDNLAEWTILREKIVRKFDYEGVEVLSLSVKQRDKLITKKGMDMSLRLAGVIYEKEDKYMGTKPLEEDKSNKSKYAGGCKCGKDNSVKLSCNHFICLECAAKVRRNITARKLNKKSVKCNICKARLKIRYVRLSCGCRVKIYWGSSEDIEMNRFDFKNMKIILGTCKAHKVAINYTEQYAIFGEMGLYLAYTPLYKNDIGIIASFLSAQSIITVLDLTESQVKISGAAELAIALQTNQTLEKLKLGMNNLSDIAAEHLAMSLNVNHTLKELLIGCNSITDVGVKYIATALKVNSTLEILNLMGNMKVTDVGIAQLATALEVNTTLKELELKGIYMVSSSAKRVETILSSNKALKFLGLSMTYPTDTDIEVFAIGLQSNHTLKSLDLICNKISDAGVEQLAVALGTNETLEKLYLNRNSITDEGADKLAILLQINRTLRELRLRDNQIGDSGSEQFAIALQGNQTLKLLMLDGNKISDVGAGKIGTALKSNHALKYLSLSGNKITGVGAKHLAMGLQLNLAIETFILEYCKIADVGAGYFAEVLKVNKVLENLYLCNDGIEESGTTKIAMALKVNSTLKELKLGGNKISIDGAEEFARALLVNKTLELLDLEESNISESGAKYLGKAMLDNKTLEILMLCNNPILYKKTRALLEKDKRIKISYFRDGELVKFQKIEYYHDLIVVVGD